MAEFNPQIQDTGVINETARSKGTGPNRTFETLFSGLTETAQNVIQIEDTQNQLDIEKEAQGMFEDVNKEFGVSAPAPDGVQDGLEQIQTLQNALSQGKISEVNYYGRLATLSKQLRTKYPGYENVVDSTIQSVTGTRPANAYRDALFAEIGRMQDSASNEEKFKRQWIKENEGILSAVYGDEFFADPDSFQFEKIQSDVARWKGRAETIEAENKELTLMSKRGEFNDKRASRALDRDFSFVTESILNRAVGANSPSFQDSLNQFIAKGGGTEQELSAFIGTISQAETELRTSLLQRGREKYVAAGLISNDELNKAIDAAMFPLTAAKEAVLGGDFKLAARYATINKAISDKSLNDLLQDPTIRAGQGLSQINNALGEEFFRTRIDAVGDVALELTGRAMIGQEDIVKRAVEHGDNAVSRGVIDQSFRAITDPKLSGENLSNVVDQFFGPRALDFMDPRNVKAEDLETIYTKFLDPRVTKAIFERGTREDQQKYIDWAVSKFKAIPAFAAAAGDVNSAFDNRERVGLRVNYDDQNNRIFLTVPDRSGNVTTGGVLNTGVYSRAVNAFNKSISVLDPIIKAAGVDRQEVMGRLLKDLSIQVDGVNPDKKSGENTTFWGSVYDELMKPIGELGKPGVDPMTTESIGQELPETAQEDPGEIDFLFEPPESVGMTQPVIDAASGSMTGDFEDFRNLSDPVEIASKFDGLHERSDKDVISAFIKKAGGINIDPSTTAWCAAFVNAVLGASGSSGTGRLNARSFLDWGTPVKTPSKGDVVILERGGKNSWTGHVGFVVDVGKDTVTILGGNQGNRVSQKKFPKDKVLGYRRPA